MMLITKVICFAIMGFLLGSQFFRYVSVETKAKPGVLKEAPGSYWLSFVLTLAAMLAVIVFGSQFGLFEKSSYGVLATASSFIVGAVSVYLGYWLTKWRAREKAI